MLIICHCLVHYCSRDLGVRETSELFPVGQTGWITLSWRETTSTSVLHCSSTTWTDFKFIYTTVRPQRSNGWFKCVGCQDWWQNTSKPVWGQVCTVHIQLVLCLQWEHPSSALRRFGPALLNPSSGLCFLVLFSIGGPSREAVCNILRK